jgi:hypothetical protein
LMHLCCESGRESSFHSGTAAVEITAPRSLVFAFVFLLFPPIWIFYPIHSFFLFSFPFFHLTLRRPTRYLYIRKARHANPIFAANFSTNSI